MIFGSDYSGVSVISLMRIGPDSFLEINKLVYARANKFCFLLCSLLVEEGKEILQFSILTCDTALYLMHYLWVP